MEPSLISEGNNAAYSATDSGFTASMEPSLISEGNGTPRNYPVFKDLRGRTRAAADAPPGEIKSRRWVLSKLIVINELLADERLWHIGHHLAARGGSGDTQRVSNGGNSSISPDTKRASSRVWISRTRR